MELSVWNFPCQRLLHRFGRRGGRLQNGHWRALQTVRHVLVRTGGREHPGLALHSQQPATGGFLENTAQCACRTQRCSAAGSLNEEFCLTPSHRARHGTTLTPKWANRQPRSGEWRHAAHACRPELWLTPYCTQRCASRSRGGTPSLTRRRDARATLSQARLDGRVF